MSSDVFPEALEQYVAQGLRGAWCVRSSVHADAGWHGARAVHEGCLRFGAERLHSLRGLHAVAEGLAAMPPVLADAAR